MRLLLTLTLVLAFAGTTSAQRNLKLNFKLEKNYSATSEQWSKAKNVTFKYIFKFRKKEIIEIGEGGTEKVYKMTSWSEATDDQTLEDCFLVFTKDGDEALRMIVYKNEKRGLRIIKKNGNIKHYYSK